MEKYIVKELVGQGVLSVVHKVTSVTDNQKINILKKMECLDTSNAESAFEEFLHYQKIHHHHICKIHDTFVEWDNSISSAFLCYTMDYFTDGDLATLLNNHRQNSEIVSLQLVKKWLAILIEGLNHLSKYNLIHRNLKPSSLYLRNYNLNNDKNDLSIQIGDFGVYTIMRDAKTKTRILPGAYDYTAPEIIDAQSYDEKSDIWSIGTILLDICSTSLYDIKDFHQNLLKIRFSDEILEEILADIHNVYKCKPLIDLLRQLLQKNKLIRPDYRILLGKPFVKECLKLIDSEIVKYHGIDDAGSSDIPLPKDGSIEKLTKFLRDNIHKEARVQEAIIRIAELEIKDVNFTNEPYQSLLLEIMETFSNNLKIQESVLKLIESSLNLTVNQKNNNGFLDLKLLQKFIFIFIKHSNSFEIQSNAIRCLIQLSNFGVVSPYLAKYNIIKYLLQDLEKYKADPIFCGNTCKAIWSLSTHDDILKTYANMKCLKHMRNTLNNHQANAFVVEMVCNVITALGMHEQLIADEELNVDITSAILVGFKENVASPDVVKSVCLAVTALVNWNEECAFRFIYLPKMNEEEAVDGIELLRKAYNIHRDDSEVVESICGVFKQFCIYDEMITELKSLRLDEHLFKQIVKRYRDNQNIASQCDFICNKIQEKLDIEKAH